ncbi:MAG: MurR/RpiR family transcriptional regulator, partial [Clostridiales bacterium]|nr:MurR/RpiR family transcriptional regulator [Clostridiales bacterium]
MVNGARRIYIIGVRSSSALAGFLAFYFRLIYDNVMLVDTAGGSEIFESLMRSNGDDVCIAVSFPRYSKQILNALSFVRERGTKVVAITDSGATSLAELADEVLLAKSDMASFVDSLVAPLSLINALIVAAAHDRRAEMAQQLAKLEEVWDRYQVYEKEEPHE